MRHLRRDAVRVAALEQSGSASYDLWLISQYLTGLAWKKNERKVRVSFGFGLVKQSNLFTEVLESADAAQNAIDRITQ